MSLQVVTVESASECEVFGVYLTEKLAKLALSKFVEIGYKKKLVKKDNEDTKKLVYLEDSKEEDKKSIFMTSVPFVMPVGKKTKKTKDPLAPKKSLSGFMMFSNEHRSSVKESNPEATFGEIGRLVGQAWKELEPKSKSVYTGRAETDKQRYLSEFERYTAGTATVTATESESEPEVVLEVTSKKPRAKKVVS